MDRRTRNGSTPVAERIFGDPGRIAPSIEKTWRDDFIVELRLLSVPGNQIGDALMTVESHVAEADEGAQAAFGDPKAYAQEIAAATGAEGAGWRASPRTVVGLLLGLMGMVVSTRAFDGWLEGGPVNVTTGELVGLVVLLLLAGTIFFTSTLRVIVEHRWLALPVPALLVGAMAGLFLLFREPLVTVPSLPLGAMGVALLVVSVVLGWLDDPDDLDEITAPGQVASATLRTRLLTNLAMPLMTLLLLVFTWILHLVTS